MKTKNMFRVAAVDKLGRTVATAYCRNYVEAREVARRLRKGKDIRHISIRYP